MLTRDTGIEELAFWDEEFPPDFFDGIYKTKPQPLLMLTATWAAEQLRRASGERSNRWANTLRFGSPSQSQIPASWPR